MGPSHEDIQDRKRTILLALILCGLVLAAGTALVLIVGPFILEVTSAGLDLKEAAVIAFGVTLALLIILAIAAGDGLLGEIQYMIPAFGIFFITIWLGIAWVF